MAATPPPPAGGNAGQPGHPNTDGGNTNGTVCPPGSVLDTNGGTNVCVPVQH